MLEDSVCCERPAFFCFWEGSWEEVIVNILRIGHSNKNPNVINANKTIVVNAFIINQVKEVFSRKYFLSTPQPLNSINVPRTFYPRIFFAPESQARKSMLE